MIQFQAHRGVSTEYPENTMAAFRGAICQEYSAIELDPAVTGDGVFVVLHDSTINRTARRQDGSTIEEQIRIMDITYAEADTYEYGSWFSPKFKGEKLPLLADVLQLAKENDILIKIDNKIWGFPEKYMESFWKLLRESGAKLAITCNTLETTITTLGEIPDAEIHYDGPVHGEALSALTKLTDKLVVWLPYECPATSWVKVPFASEELCQVVKQYAKLGIWIISNQADFEDAGRRFQPDLVETTGHIKPVKNVGKLVDLHTHSEHSHDSVCPIRDMAASQQAKGMYAFAVTDHCDVLSFKPGETVECIRDSVAQVEAIRAEADKTAADKADSALSVKVLSGVEIGEGICRHEVTADVLKMCAYDVVIGSVHILKYKQYDMAYSRIDFSKMSEEDIYGYMDAYFDDLLLTLQTVPCDVAAHINSPLRYINGKYARNIDITRFDEKIQGILQFIIQHGIALEINTSGMTADGMDLLEQEHLLEMYVKMSGFLVTMGSDAHKPEAAAHGFDKAVALLKKHGLKNYFYFDKRQSVQCTVE